MGRLLFWIVALLALPGCIRYFNYYYASLEEIPGIEITLLGEVSLSNLKGSSTIPKGYILRREHYSLSFIISDKGTLPNLEITVSNLDGTTLKLEPRIRIAASSHYGVNCAYAYPDEKNKASYWFGWDSACWADRIPKYISLDVIDEEGRIVGSEDLPFSLKKNGWYIIYDGL